MPYLFPKPNAISIPKTQCHIYSQNPMPYLFPKPNAILFIPKAQCHIYSQNPMPYLFPKLNAISIPKTSTTFFLCNTCAVDSLIFTYYTISHNIVRVSCAMCRNSMPYLFPKPNVISIPKTQCHIYSQNPMPYLFPKPIAISIPKTQCHIYSQNPMPYLFHIIYSQKPNSILSIPKAQCHIHW